MSSARDEILSRIRTALSDRPAAAVVPREYRVAGGASLDRATLLDLFVERVTDYQATVRRCAAVDVAVVIGQALAAREIERVVVPAGFPYAAGIEPAVEQLADDPPLSVQQLNGVAGVLTSCALAIAETGTIVLDAGPGQGRRALTLVPDYHLIVVRAAQVAPGVPEAIAALRPTEPLTWISGPSATSDIELSRVEGVHGPRTLEVVLIDED